MTRSLLFASVLTASAMVTGAGSGISRASMPGVGKGRSKALLVHFGSARALKNATVADIAAVPGFSETLAGRIVAALAADRPPADQP